MTQHRALESQTCRTSTIGCERAGVRVICGKNCSMHAIRVSLRAHHRFISDCPLSHQSKAYEKEVCVVAARRKPAGPQRTLDRRQHLPVSLCDSLKRTVCCFEDASALLLNRGHFGRQTMFLRCMLLTTKFWCDTSMSRWKCRCSRPMAQITQPAWKGISHGPG